MKHRDNFAFGLLHENQIILNAKKSEIDILREKSLYF